LFDISLLTYKRFEEYFANGFRPQLSGFYSLPEKIAELVIKDINLSSFNEFPKPEALDNDIKLAIESVMFKNPSSQQSPIVGLNVADDQYRCLGVSTAHLSPEAQASLEREQGGGMIMERDTGWFVKLYDDINILQQMNLSTDLLQLLFTIHDAGFRMVEFDADAQIHNLLTQYEE